VTTTSTKTSITGTGTGTTTKAKTVSGSFTVSGVDYAKLNSDAALKEAFEDKCRRSLADGAGSAVSHENVEITLSVPPFTVSYKMTLPHEEGSQAAARDGLLSSSLNDGLQTALQDIHGIGPVVTGDIAVSNMQVDGSTTPAPVASSTSTSLHHPQSHTLTEQPEEPEEPEGPDETGGEPGETHEGEGESEEGEEAESEGEELPESLTVYAAHLGEKVEVAAVTLRFLRPAWLVNATHAQKLAIKECVEEYIVHSLEPMEEDFGITFRVMRSTLVADGNVKLRHADSSHMTLSKCEAALADDEKKKKFTSQVNSRLGELPDGKSTTLSPADIQLDIFESTEDDFFQWDSNFDTSLDVEEFINAGRQMLGLPFGEKDLKEVFKLLDKNNDNMLTADEFFMQEA
jgi:hypothetical protein